MKLLVVDDDLELLNLISFALRQAGYFVVQAADGAEALHVFEQEQPDLVILDVNLPKLSGLDVLQRIRGESTTPVMLLTVRSSEEDQIRGLDLGADDYLTKPFSPRTLLARVRALLRRAGLERSAPQHAGDIQLDVEQQTVSMRGGAPVRLTNLEFRLLQYLMTHAGTVVPFAVLIRQVWGYDDPSATDVVRTTIYRLRRKLQDDPATPQLLRSIPGVGFLLIDAPPPARRDG